MLESKLSDHYCGDHEDGEERDERHRDALGSAVIHASEQKTFKHN
jgi:hypothetical protein